MFFEERLQGGGNVSVIGLPVDPNAAGIALDFVRSIEVMPTRQILLRMTTNLLREREIKAILFDDVLFESCDEVAEALIAQWKKFDDATEQNLYVQPH
ncbi:hypothetical protein PMAYCL1PPCAC_24911 [Pristionchus mayeri]|uniref:Uncharacterized protein n=1 Tax=Pristionchus mayeri TaxID=1317129 RepID=A0AAN5D1L9_9BILA|nr:hypothetical protein PMAYCL1PPCAC_24911 [Pristionchus mayeri]